MSPTRPRLTAVLAVLAVCAIVRPAAAAERPGPAVNPAPKLPAVLQSDPRLEKKLTLKLHKTSLSKVLAALHRETGVRMTAIGEVISRKLSSSVSRGRTRRFKDLAKMRSRGWHVSKAPPTPC